MIRLATPQDLPAILRLLVMFHSETGLAPLDIEKVAYDVRNLTDRSDLFVAEEDGVLVGLLAIEDNELRYASDHHVLVDVYFYVAKAFRGGSIGAMLMRAATLEAERRNLPLFLRVTNPERMRRRGRVGEIAGYIPAGYIVRLR